MLLFNALDVQHNSPPSVHLFILETLDGPASGEK